MAGDTLESWRVAESEPGRRLRLRTEMKLPGEAWIEWRIADRGTCRTLVQRVVFVPKGLFGRIYGFVERPADLLLYRRLAAGVVAEAERLASLGAHT